MNAQPSMKNDTTRTGLEIAIIGMAGRFPGAKNVEQFWKNITNGVESISFFSDEELIESGIEPELVKLPNYIKAKGYLEDIEYFDAFFFDYLPRDAEQMDPQVRILHECVWEAFENAGYVPEEYNGLIGLYAGSSINLEWMKMAMGGGNGSSFQNDAFLMNFREYLCPRISYKFNLRGPSININTACSTSLLAVHLACQGLLNGECNMAAAGAVTISLPKKSGYQYFENMVFSPDGHCRTFDANAGGTIFGNGVAVVVLKTLEDAINDGDTIYAVVKGSAANNDGAQRIGFTAPGVSGQAAVIRAALYMAEVDPETISYVEAHGTATRLGDTIEIEALTQAFGTNKKKFCPIGSVKTNVGHLETASGVTGLIKTALSLKHGIIPPSLHYHAPNPEINFENTPFYVNTELTPFRQDQCPLRAGVSSFGIGGSNVHVVLEEGPENTRRMQGKKYQLIVLSAKTPTALEQMTENLAQYFNGILVNPAINDKELILADAAYTLKVGRRAFPYRRMLVCSDMKEAADILLYKDSDNDKTTSSSNALHTFQADKKERKAVFMFAGLEAQYVDMGRDIYETETVFREETDLCFEILKPLLGYDIKEVLYPPRGQVATPGKIDHVDIAQLAVFILEYALAKQLMSWGIKPSAVIGYSFGEYTAACIAGVMSLEDILKLVVARGRLIIQTSDGAMLSVPLPVQELKPLLDDELSIAIDNGASCIVAGSPHAVDRFEKQMQQRSLICIRLEAKYAIHSTLMEPILAKFLDVIKTIKLNEPCIPYISNVSGDWITAQELVDPTYWCRQIRQTAQFSKGLNLLAKQESCVFLEIGPGRDLSVMIGRRIDSDLNQKTVNLLRPQQKKVSDVYYLLSRLGWLWLYGITPNWENLYSGETRNRIPLPSYPFERKLYWPKINTHDPDKQTSVEEQPKGKKTDIGDWFYIPSWKRSMTPAPKTGGAVEHLNWLLFVDDCNIGIRLADRLKLSGYDAIIVRPGAEFSEVGADAYTINPQMGEDYETLLKTCGAKGKFPRGIVHCWNVTDAAREDVQELGFYSLLHLAGALGNRPPAEMIELTVLTDHMQEVTGGDMLYPEKATILGVALTIPQDYKNIKCRCIDIILPEPGSSHREKLVDRLFSELSATFRDEVIAYRNNYRWVKIYEPNRLKGPVGEISRLKKCGVYLIIGGLGGIGFVLAKYLVETVNARLILTGRSKLPLRETWNDPLLSNDPSNDSGVKIKKIQELERLGAEIMLLCTDVTQEEQMKEAIRLAEDRFGKIDGVIHAAGLSGESLIQGKTRETMDLILAPKVKGTLVLDALFKDKELDFFLLCSSLISVAPIAGQVAYCAANTFLNHFACYKAARDNTFTISISWDDWDEGEVFRRILAGEIPPHILVSMTELTARMEKSRRLDEFFELHLLGKGTETARHSRPDLRSAYFAPRSGIEKRMIKICEEFLGIDKLGIDDDFFELGGDSLIAISFAARIHKELNIKMDISEFFKNPTIRELAKWAEEGSGTSEKFSAIEPTEKKEYYALSSAQKRLYILEQMGESIPGYNITMAFVLEGKLNRKRLEETFKKLIQRHENFRTSFKIMGDIPVQRIHKEVEFEIGYYIASDEKAERKIVSEFQRPFDLSLPPLMRVSLIETGKKRWVMLVDIHHIIADGTSIVVLQKEFMTLYKGEELPLITLQYKDFPEYQNKMVRSGEIKKQEEYWLNQFEGDIPVLDLPLDYARPAVQSFEGSSINFEINSKISGALKALALETGTTLYIVLLALYAIFLSKLSSQEDIVVGSLTAGRRHADLEKIIGMFVNTLVLRNYPVGEKTFTGFLHEVKEKVLSAFENQDYQYGDLVDSVVKDRDASWNPLFDTMFVLQNMDIGEINIPGLKLSSYSYENKTSKFDLSLIGMEVEKKLLFTFEYSTKLFKRETIERFIAYFINIIKGVIENSRKQISGFEMITEEEKKQIIFDFNNTESEYPQEKTIHQLFAEQIERTPDHIAVFGQGRTRTNTDNMFMAITYHELNEKSNRLAGVLQQKSVRPDSIVAIMLERSVEMMVGILGILKSGGAYLPIDPEYPQERIDYMLKDSGAKLMLEKAEERKSGRMEKIKIFEIVFIDTSDHFLASSFPRFFASNSSSFAYIIYTSGSTGKPKGVAIKHRSVINFIKGITNIIRFTSNDRTLSLTTISFDIFGLETLVPLICGSVVVMGGREEQLNPEAAANVLERQRISILQVTPSRLQMIISLPGAAVKLKILKFLLVGGEAFPESLLEKVRTFVAGKIFNMYGPTETTIWSTVKGVSIGETLNIGKPIANTSTYILDGSHKPVAIGVAGELYVGGDGLASGYLNRPELTAEKFIPNPFIPGERLYKSGDRGRWLPSGNIEFIGRIDQQVKIRGFRIELGEIGNRLAKYPGIKDVVVINREENSEDKYLCAYFVSEEKNVISGLREFLMRELPDYMIPSYFVQLEKIPLTPNGKLDRKALPKPELKARERYIAPRNEIEKKLAVIWSEVLEQTPIGINDNFFQLGGHSLKATILLSKIHKTFNSSIPLSKILMTPTIRGLANYITSTVKEKYISIEPVEKKEYYQLSSAQRRIYIALQLGLESTSYNIAFILLLIGELDRERLQETFRKLIERHESLRTSFEIVGNEPIQRVHDKVEFAIEYLSQREGTAALKKYIRAFDLTRAPLLRVYLSRTGDREYAMMVDISHLISDGFSSTLMTKDLMTLYNRQELPPLNIQYKGFSEWESALFRTGSIKKQENFWFDTFNGELPVLELPTDFPRPDLRNADAGDIITTILEAPSLRKLNDIVQETGSTLFTILLAIYNVLLNKYSGQEDIVVGSVVTGRTHEDLENVIGVFINMLPLRNHPQSGKRFREFLEEVKENAFHAFENQDYPMEELVKKLGIRNNPGRHPLFDTEFAVNNIELEEIAIPGLKMEYYDSGINFAKFDLHFLAVEQNNSLNLTLRYSTELFKKTTAEKIIEHFVEITKQVLENPGVKLEDIEITIDLMTMKSNSLEKEQGDFNF